MTRSRLHIANFDYRWQRRLGCIVCGIIGTLALLLDFVTCKAWHELAEEYKELVGLLIYTWRMTEPEYMVEIRRQMGAP